ncbi:MAG: 23S rRNA (pseudouridine(1915)-N(3))-methyltransferase RlmH [Bacillota bacterium]
MTLRGRSNLAFLIDVFKREDLRLLCPKMPFPYQLMRLILLEQTYRHLRIARGKPYHKRVQFFIK